MDSDNSDVSLRQQPRGAFTLAAPGQGLDGHHPGLVRSRCQLPPHSPPDPEGRVPARGHRPQRYRRGSHPFHSSTPPALSEVTEDWELPDEEIITRVKLGFTSRLLEKSALKLSGWVAVQKNDDPAYGTSFEDSQELFLSASYNPSPLWGFLASLNLLKQENNDFGIQGFEIIEPATYEFADET